VKEKKKKSPLLEKKRRTSHKEKKEEEGKDPSYFYFLGRGGYSLRAAEIPSREEPPRFQREKKRRGNIYIISRG